MENINVSELLTEYSQYLRHIVGYAEGSIRIHLSHIKRFLIYSFQSAKTPLNLQRADIESYLYGQGMSTQTIRRAISCINVYYKYLHYQSKLLKNPMVGITPPSEAKRLHHTWSEEDIERLLAVPDANELLGLRNRVILELLYDTGIRNSELRQLVVTDINLSERHLRIRGKGGKERLVPLNDGAINWLKVYFPRRRELFKEDITPVLFPAAGKGTPLAICSLLLMVKKYARQAGLSSDFTVHSLRHAFASHMLARGADVHLLQLLLGHNDIQTTEIYTQLQVNHLQELHNKYHPRADWPKNTTVIPSESLNDI